MGIFSLNDDHDYATIGAGRHLMQITKAVLKTSSAGNKMINFEFTVIESEFEGAKWKEWITLVKGRHCMGKLARMCIALGIQGIDDDPSGINPFDQESILTHLAGAVLDVRVEMEESQGRDGKTFTNPRVSADDDGFKAPSMDITDKLNAMYESGGPYSGDSLYSDFKGNSLRGNGQSHGGTGELTYQADHGTAEFDDGFKDSDIPF